MPPAVYPARRTRSVAVPANGAAAEAVAQAKTRARRTPPAPLMPVASPTLRPRLEIEYMDINDIQPYEWNPRQNAHAVKNVAASMELTGGFAMPVIVDSNNVLIAGHTRIEAAKSLGYVDAPVVRLTHLTPEQVNAFRIVDNKVAEQSKWDYDVLAGEIGKLGGINIDWTLFGWNQVEIDCMSQLVTSDCLSAETLLPEAEAASSAATVAAGRRAPGQARFVLGELVFFLPIEAYRVWSDGIRQLNDFDEARIAADLQRRLGILATA